MRLTSLLILGSAATATAQQAGWQGSFDARLYAGYFDQSTRAGESGMTTSTWLMARLGHSSARRQLGVQLMLSGDAPINGECGQPRLLPQTFECGDNAAPSHPLVMELGGTARALLGATSLGVTVALVGEPAFGPPPHFMRASSRFDPGGPLTHHYFNPAHSAQGVVTAELVRRAWRVEASAFNPFYKSDSYRVDPGPLKGSAVRLSVAPGAALQLQASMAYLPADESGASHHGHSGDMHAYSVTASGALGRVDYTAGCAAHRIAHRTPTACVGEAVVTLGVHTLSARVEGLDRLEQNNIVTIAPDGSHVHSVVNEMMKTAEAAVGYALQLPARLGWQPVVGARAAVTSVPDYFRQRYLAEHAAAATVFMSLRPRQPAPHHH